MTVLMAMLVVVHRVRVSPAAVAAAAAAAAALLLPLSYSTLRPAALEGGHVLDISQWMAASSCCRGARAYEANIGLGRSSCGVAAWPHFFPNLLHR
jgi:hypothetical protein